MEDGVAMVGTSLYKVGGIDFSKFSLKGRESEFSHKKEGVGKIRRCSKKGGMTN